MENEPIGKALRTTLGDGLLKLEKAGDLVIISANPKESVDWLASKVERECSVGLFNEWELRDLRFWLSRITLEQVAYCETWPDESQTIPANLHPKVASLVRKIDDFIAPSSASRCPTCGKNATECE